MKSFIKNQSGISLAELLIAISIISILSFILMNFMVNWIEQHSITQSRAALLTDAQDTLDFVSDTIRLSSAADQNNRWQDPNSPGAPANQFSWQSNANTLVLASAVEDTNGNIIFSDPSNYTSQKNNQIFFVSGGVLYRRTLAASVANNKSKTTCPAASASSTCPADRKLAGNVTSFSVRYLNAENQEVQPTNARSVELSLTLQKSLFGQMIESSDKTRMVFRND